MPGNALSFADDLCSFFLFFTVPWLSAARNCLSSNVCQRIGQIYWAPICFMFSPNLVQCGSGSPGIQTDIEDLLPHCVQIWHSQVREIM